MQAMPQLLEQIRAIMEAPATTAVAVAPGGADSSAPVRRRKAMHECLEEMADVCQRVQDLLSQ